MKNKKHKKINYNPFKMIGSWIGAFIAFFGYLPLIYFLEIQPLPKGMVCVYGCNVPSSFGDFLNNIFNGATLIQNVGGLLYMFVIIGGIGFLLGWGIESLIKYLSRK